jgi:hypothetical protein
MFKKFAAGYIITLFTVFCLIVTYMFNNSHIFENGNPFQIFMLFCTLGGFLGLVGSMIYIVLCKLKPDA